MSIWLKQILLARYGDEMQQHCCTGNGLRSRLYAAHQQYPSAVLLHCVDPRFCGFGNLLLQMQVFHALRTLYDGKEFILYGQSVAGPDRTLHIPGDAVSACFHSMAQNTVQVARADVLVIVPHANCAGVPVTKQEHLDYAKHLADDYAPFVPVTTEILVFFAHARTFGWRLELLSWSFGKNK